MHAIFDSPQGIILASALERGAVVCVSTQRLARVLRHAWQNRLRAQGQEAWRSPDILPLSAWQRRLAAALEMKRAGEGRPLPGVLAEQQELLTWEQAAGESGVLDGVLQPLQLAAAMMDAHTLAELWDIRFGGEDILAGDATVFASVRSRVEERWRKLGVAPGARIAWRAVDALRELQPPREIVFAGFDLPPDAVFLATVAALESRGSQVQVLRADAPAGEWRFLRYQTFEDELRAAAWWCRKLLERGEGDIGVVIPHLDAVRVMTSRVFAGVLQPSALLRAPGERHDLLELSLGPRAIDEPLIHSAILALDLLRPGLPLEQWTHLLLSPFFRDAENAVGVRARVDAELRRRGMREADAGDVLQVADALHVAGRISEPSRRDALLDALRTLPDSGGRRAAAEWADCFADTLDALGWPGDRALTSREFQAHSRFRELLDEFHSLDAVAGMLTCSEALARLRVLAASRVFQVRSTSAPVQIMGVRETAGLRFRHLRVLGMNDDIWPPVPRPTVFIPLALQRHAGVPESSPERFLQMSRTQTELLHRLAPDVIFSCAASEGERELLPTPLLGDDPPEDQPLPAGDVLAAMGGACAGDLASVTDDIAPPVTEAERIRGGTRVLTLQSSCPFRAFAELRLFATRPEAVQHGVRALDRGTLVHATLEVFWQRVKDRASLLALAEEGTRRVVEECVDQAMGNDRAMRVRRVDRHVMDAERENLVILILEWLDVERKRTPFSVEQRERKVTVSLSGLSLEMYADRVDRLDDGSTVLLDYKTGKKSVFDWMTTRPAEPQIPLYVQAMDHDIRGAGFALLLRGDSRIAGLRDDALDAPEFTPAAEWLDRWSPGITDWDALRLHWSAVLRHLAEDFLAGAAAVDPRDENSCRWCDLAAFCRVRSGHGEEGDDGED